MTEDTLWGDGEMDEVDLLAVGRKIFSTVPFLSLVGLEIVEASPTHAVGRIRPRPDLIGNPHQQILHGGVISTVMDSVGGLVGILNYLYSAAEEGAPEKWNEAMARIVKIATIDMRSDYLSPGRGEWFVCEGRLLRLGNHVVASRTEFRNDAGRLIAVGTGTYNY